MVCGVKFKTVAHKPQFIFDESQTSEHLAIFIVSRFPFLPNASWMIFNFGLEFLA